jgi:hypothetical protein
VNTSIRTVTQDIVDAAQRSNAAYFTHPDQSKAVFEHLGYAWLGMFQNDSSQAVLSTKNGEIFLSISGTRASALKLEDIFLDVDLTPFDVGTVNAPAVAPLIIGKGSVTRGVYADLGWMWAWVMKTASPKCVIHVDGHSLGGARSQLTPLFLPKERIGCVYSFEAPKFAEPSYFTWAIPFMPQLVCTLNGADGWAAWPWDDKVMIRPPIDHLWLQNDGNFQWIQPHLWPGGMDFHDHDIDLVVKRLQRFAAHV